MVEEGIVGMGITDETVIAAMSAVPRHRFVPEEWLAQAYENHPLPIGHGQTISQPYIVALMTEAAEVGESDRVLEIGTGSGYQAAILAEIVDRVYTVEIIGALAERAEATLETLGYDNVTVRHADGYYGWDEEGPFDAILVTAAPDHILSRWSPSLRWRPDDHSGRSGRRLPDVMARHQSERGGSADRGSGRRGLRALHTGRAGVVAGRAAKTSQARA